MAVSQSGATEEIVTTLEWARRHGARTVAVTNEAGSPLTEFADVPLITQAGEELAVPATKTYTTQLAAMAVLAHALHRSYTGGVGVGGVGRGGPGGGGVGVEELLGVPEAVGAMLGVAGAAEGLAGRLGGVDALVVSGRGSRTRPRWSWR